MEKIWGIDTYILFIVAIVIAVVSYFFSPSYRISKQLKNTRRKPIQNVRENEYVKIVGKAVNFDMPLTAPMSKRSCVYYKIVVERKI
jgi:hypothetical protein